MTQVFDLAQEDRDTAVAAAARVLGSGRLVVMPTDTVYGLAADAFDPRGTRRVFEAKQRDRTVPLPVLVHTPKQVPGLCPDVPESAQRLMAAYWPGALTLVVAAQPGLRWDLGGDGGTVAVRMPLDDVALAVIRAVGPLAVTSANISNRPPATTVDDARTQLGDTVDCYLDDGPRTGGAPSTIVDVSRADPEVLRAGDLDANDVLAVASGALDPIEAARRHTDVQDRHR